MNRISDERLDELIAHVSCPGMEWWKGLESALRELRDYRKAVREYLGAYDDNIGKPNSTTANNYFVALSALRALAQPEEKP